MEAFVDVLHAFGAVISFGYHFHFYLRAFHTVTLAYHGAEHPVAAEVGISRDEEVAQIDRIDDIPFDGVYYREKAVHLLCRVGHDDRLEVVSILQAVADACCNGVDVFQHRSVFDADDVVAGFGLDVFAADHVGKVLRRFQVGASYGQISKPSQSHFFRMARPSQTARFSSGTLYT